MAKFPLGAPDKWVDALGGKRTGPTINRGKGNNNAATPWIFANAVQKKFGALDWDLAASAANTKARFFLTEQDNSLNRSWADLWPAVNRKPLCWLNPPFTNITPWARKCAEECQLGARILLLVPASVGANWAWDWVFPYADVYSVGRMVFDDCYDKHGELITTPYPKDLVLAHYELGVTGRSYADHHADPRAELIRWRWQNGN